MAKLNKDFLCTTVVNNEVEFSAWAKKIRDAGKRSIVCRVVGLTYKPKPVATFRFCIGSSCLVYKLTDQSDVPKSLNNFLHDAFTFVGPNVESDIKIFEKDFGIEPMEDVGMEPIYIEAVDLWPLAMKLYDEKPDLSKANLKELLDLVLDKGSNFKCQKFVRTPTVEKEQEMLKKLSKAREAIGDFEAMMANDLEIKIDGFFRIGLEEKIKDHLAVLDSFVCFGLGEFMQAAQPFYAIVWPEDSDPWWEDPFYAKDIRWSDSSNEAIKPFLFR